MKYGLVASVSLAFTLAACGDEVLVDKASPPSSLDINSAKRSCRNTAEIAMLGAGVPAEAIQRICDCSIDSLVETGDFKKTGAISDEKMNAAMESCLDTLDADLVAAEEDAASE